MRNQKNKRRFTDGILNMLTYASSAICVLGKKLHDEYPGEKQSSQYV